MPALPLPSAYDASLMESGPGVDSASLELDSAYDEGTEELGSGTQAGSPCYSGFFGTCIACDTHGSCICADDSDGLSDFVLMDRTRWGEPRLLCTINSSTVDALNIIAMVMALVLIARIVRSLRVQRSTARECSVPSWKHKPLIALGFCFSGLLLSIAMHLLKLLDPGQILGVDPLPSAISFLRKCCFFVAFMVHNQHATQVAARTQEIILGRQEILRIIQRKERNLNLQALVGIFGALLPTTAATLSNNGFHTLKLQTTLFISSNAIGALCTAVAVYVGMSDLRFFKRWFNASIQASKDSYAIGAGGASRVQEAKRLRKGTILEQQSATLETVAQLERSRDSILAFGRRVTAATIALGLSYLVSAAVPFMWTHMSYVTPAQSIFYTALSYPVVQVYRKDKKGGLLRIIAARIRSLGQRGSFSKFATSSVDDRFSGAELSRLSNVLQEI